MKLKHRVAVFCSGLLAVLYGFGMLNRGIAVYLSGRYRVPVYSAGVIATGVFFSLLAFLPPPALIERLRRKNRSSRQPLVRRCLYYGSLPAMAKQISRP